MHHLHQPTRAEAQRAVDECRRKFQRALAAWVCDLLVLRRQGLTCPDWRPDLPETGLSEAA